MGKTTADNFWPPKALSVCSLHCPPVATPLNLSVTSHKVTT